MTFTEKHSILNNQLVGDEDDVYIFTTCLGEMLREKVLNMFKEKSNDF